MGKHHGDFKMRLYEKDCPNIMDRFNMSNFHSCHMMDDHWLVYEQPNYMGRDFYLRPGEYRRYSDWDGSSRMGSIRRIMGL